MTQNKRVLNLRPHPSLRTYIRRGSASWARAHWLSDVSMSETPGRTFMICFLLASTITKDIEIIGKNKKLPMLGPWVVLLGFFKIMTSHQNQSTPLLFKLLMSTLIIVMSYETILYYKYQIIANRFNL